jgi:hypothetical protein
MELYITGLPGAASPLPHGHWQKAICVRRLSLLHSLLTEH